MNKTKIINLTYKSILLLSLPAVLWTVLDMYLITLFRPQMLFYSLSHGLPVFIIIFTLSTLFFWLLLGVNLLFVILNSINIDTRVPIRIISLILGFQLILLVATFTYEVWVVIPVLRVVISLLGILFAGYVFLIGFKVLYSPNKSLQPTAESGG